MIRSVLLASALACAPLVAAPANAAVITEAFVLTEFFGFINAPISGTGTLAFTFDDTALAGSAGTITPSNGLLAFSVMISTFSDVLSPSSEDGPSLTFAPGDVLTGIYDHVGDTLEKFFSAADGTYSIFYNRGNSEGGGGLIAPVPAPAWATMPSLIALMTLRSCRTKPKRSYMTVRLRPRLQHPAPA